MNTNDLILSSLEIASEKAGDITDPVYQHYFAACPESKELMWHLDKLVQGKMLEEVLRLLMLEEYTPESGYLNFEVRTHQQSYSVLGYMYDNLLNSILKAVKEAVDKDWSPEFEAAWQRRIDSLLKAIKAHTVD